MNLEFEEGRLVTKWGCWGKSKIGSNLGEGGSRVERGLDTAALKITPEVPVP